MKNRKVQLTLILTIILFSLMLLPAFPSLFNKLYQNGFFPALTWFIRLFSGLFSFALSEIIYLLLLIFLPYLLFRKIRTADKKNYFNVLYPLIITILILLIIYNLVWGLNYKRDRIGLQLGLKKTEINQEKLILLNQFFIKKTNDLYAKQIRINRAHEDLVQETKLSYMELAKIYAQFNYTNPAIKATLFPKLWSNLGVEGYYNPITAEANINSSIKPWVKPFVMAHEVAHQFGIAYEDEANLIGYLASKENPKPDIQYSAYYSMLRYLLIEVANHDPESYKALYYSIDPGVLAHYEQERKFWESHNESLSQAMNITFDNFLKWNNQDDGIKTYAQITQWLWDIHKKEIEK